LQPVAKKKRPVNCNTGQKGIIVCTVKITKIWHNVKKTKIWHTFFYRNNEKLSDNRRSTPITILGGGVASAGTEYLHEYLHTKNIVSTNQRIHE